MILQRLWKNYSYVILLILISFILGIVNLHILSADGPSEPSEQKQSENHQYVVEWTSSTNN